MSGHLLLLATGRLSSCGWSFFLVQQGMLEGGGNSQQMQDSIAQMMNSPIMQNMLNNPELLRTMFQANPAVRDVRSFAVAFL